MLDLILLKKYNGKTMPSGNPILYQAAISPAGYNYQQVYVQFTLKVQHSPGSAIYDLVRTEKQVPDSNGLFSFDISSLCSPYLEYFVPDANLDNTVDCVMQIRNFQVTIDLYWQANNNNKEATVTDTVRVFKGGVDHKYFLPVIGNRIYSNEEHFLFFSEPDENSGKLKETVFEDDKFWLYLLLPGGGASPYYFAYTLIYIDTTGEEVRTRFSNLFAPVAQLAESRIICMPAGYLQNNLQINLPAGCTAVGYYIDVYYKNESGNTVRRNFDPYPIFYLEQRKFYNTRKLLYRSSLGSLMPLTIRGQIDEEAAYESQTSNTRKLEWIKDGNVVGTKQQGRAIEDYKFKGETGLLSQFEAERLRDFFMSNERYELKDGRLVPITVNNKNVKYFSNKDSLYSLTVEWQYAFRNVHWSLFDLKGDSCPAMLHFEWRQSYVNTISVYYSLPPGYNFFRVNVLFPNEPPQYYFIEGNSGVADVTFTRPASASGEVDITVDANVMCNRYNKVPSYGPLFATDPQTLAPVAPMFAGADTFNVPAGLTAPTVLEGSILENDSHPSGTALEAVAVTNVATIEGGTISIDADGIVTYEPPSSSFTGVDGYVYTVQTVGGAESTTGTITFRVGIATSGVWASVLHEELTPSGFSFYYNKHYIALWSNPGWLIPFTGTLLVNYKRITTQYVVDGAGQWVVNGVPAEATLNVQLTNASRALIYTGNPEVITLVGMSLRKTVISWEVLPGTGYTAS